MAWSQNSYLFREITHSTGDRKIEVDENYCINFSMEIVLPTI